MKTAKEELMQLKEDLKRLESAIEETIRDGGEQILQTAEGKFSHITEMIKKEAAPVIQSLEATGKHINEYVCQKKWQSIGIALGAGLLAGLIIFRGKK